LERKRSIKESGYVEKRKEQQMKSKINERNPPSSTVLPLSFQERGRGKLVESRDELADELDQIT